MYSLVMIVCIFAQGECLTIAPDTIFPSKQACEVAYDMALGIAEDDVNIDVMDAECVNWGVGS